ncbi:cobalt-precorrin-5B (C(1))-methyltransferase [Pelagibius litoralis]|uniref:Cobalt-precorrin-5B C(1)-methyltransferase n=1 Tax=Pelagibius litoralis TaxID=374515 RepID=A0A967C5X6_9PROT|nr:cobalt-precorrin-5B (C(1))-methyltransferase [Pelagibius litoralis]NIA69165.1 cobalt-precorrin-5B (C(1))-methyltransferase [Pelagibius litoralis]
MTRKPEGELKRGWTTGACATAATKAAYTALLTGGFPDPVTITLPKGEQPAFALAREKLEGGAASAAIVKDAGDDPDVTHLALVGATIRLGAPGQGVVFKAGTGVGTVTKPGLPLAVGEPAINPVPRQMMQAVIAEVASAHGATGDVEVEISVEDGAALAEKTWNPRLGILGGLSILGTTGVVVPFSCSAWIHSIHRGIDVARANKLPHVAACTGSTSEAAVQQRYDLPEIALLDMGDFAGGLLKYLRKHPLPRLTIGGGFGKLCKLAAGHLDLHSGRSQVDFDLLANTLEGLDAAPKLVDDCRRANTAKQVLDIATAAGLPLADSVAAAARTTALSVLGGETAVEVLIFDRQGKAVGRAAEAADG